MPLRIVSFFILIFSLMPLTKAQATLQAELAADTLLLKKSNIEITATKNSKKDTSIHIMGPQPPKTLPTPQNALFLNTRELLKQPSLEHPALKTNAVSSLTQSSEIKQINIDKIQIEPFSYRVNNIDLLNTHNESKTMGADIRLSKNFRIETAVRIGLSSSPYIPTIEKHYNVYAGTAFSPKENMRYKLGLNYGSYMRHNYLQPDLSAEIRLSKRIDMQFNAGAYFYNTPYSSGFKNTQLYSSLRMEYAFDSGFYLFGMAHSGYFRPYGNYGNPYLAGMYEGLGGGVGYRVSTGGRIEGGVVYNYDPRTGRFHPTPYVNMGGLFSLIVKAIAGLFED